MTTPVDEFSRILLEEAKRFYEKATTSSELSERTAYLHAALVLGFASLEANISSICEDFLTRSDLPVLDRSVLSEKNIEFTDGKFLLTNHLKMYRLEDRIEFLFVRFSSKIIDKESHWWAGFKTGIYLRNQLVHPKIEPKVTQKSVKNALKAIIELLNEMYLAIYKRKFPAHMRGLTSSLTF